MKKKTKKEQLKFQEIILCKLQLAKKFSFSAALSGRLKFLNLVIFFCCIIISYLRNGDLDGYVVDLLPTLLHNLINEKALVFL